MDLVQGHFSRTAPGDGLATSQAASTQISLKFAAASEVQTVAAVPETEVDEIPFDPRPLHIILAERKAMLDATFDEYFRMGNRVPRMEQEDAEWYNGLDDIRIAKNKRIRDEDQLELHKFRAASQEEHLQAEMPTTNLKKEVKTRKIEAQPLVMLKKSKIAGETEGETFKIVVDRKTAEVRKVANVVKIKVSANPISIVSAAYESSSDSN